MCIKTNSKEFDAKYTAAGLSSVMFTIDGIRPSSFLARLLPKVDGQFVRRDDGEIKTFADIIPHCINEHGVKLYIPKDVIGYCIKSGYVVADFDYETNHRRLKSEIDALEREKRELELEIRAISGFSAHQIQVLKSSCVLTGKKLFTEREILKAASPSGHEVCGVYFLIRQDRVIYVGQSVCVWSRVRAHSLDKQFDSVAYISCSKDELDVLETLYILFLSPPLNGSRDKKGTPVTRLPKSSILTHASKFLQMEAP